MSISPSRLSQVLLLGLLALLLSVGFSTTSLISYKNARDAVLRGIIDTELPLTSDNIYSEIQKDLIRPTQIASMMAHDTFVRDWVLAGEQDSSQITRYLHEIQQHYDTFTSFFISERTRTYYQSKGVLKQVREDEPRDIWYFRVRGMQPPSEINIDPDMANQDRLTLFLNFKMFDYKEQFIGAAGVGLTVDSAVHLLNDYQRRFDRTVYFTDSQGMITLTGSQGGPLGLRRGHRLTAQERLQPLLQQMNQPRSGRYQYALDGQEHHLNVRYIPELNWFLFVDKPTGTALQKARQTLYLNLAVCLLVSLLVLALVYLATARYQRRITALATTDVLTGLPNRRGFELLGGQALQDCQRHRCSLSVLLIDIDLFKQLNDSYGHLAGDQVLREFAQRLQGGLRQSDILCRWGGEEFVVLIKDTGINGAAQLAEKLRLQIEQSILRINQQELCLTISLGVSEQSAGDSLEQLLDRADRALYRAKQSGRNRVCLEYGKPADMGEAV